MPETICPDGHRTERALESWVQDPCCYGVTHSPGARYCLKRAQLVAFEDHRDSGDETPEPVVQDDLIAADEGDTTPLSRMAWSIQQIIQCGHKLRRCLHFPDRLICGKCGVYVRRDEDPVGEVTRSMWTDGGVTMANGQVVLMSDVGPRTEVWS